MNSNSTDPIEPSPPPQTGNNDAPAVPSPRTDPDYQPDWRHKWFEQDCVEVARAADKSAKAEELSELTKDPFVSLLFKAHFSEPTSEARSAPKWASRARDTEQVAHIIEAMVVADYSTEEIAKEFGTDKINIEAYEKIFFDVRPYLQFRGYLKTLCFGKRGHCALQVAFNRGYAGVEEVVLRHKVKRNRDLKESLSVLIGRVEDAVFAREDNNMASSKIDLEWLLRLSQISALNQLPYLQDREKEKPLTPQQELFNKATANLSPGKQEIAAILVSNFCHQAQRLAIQFLMRRTVSGSAQQNAQNGSDPVNDAWDAFESAARELESENGHRAAS